MLPVFITHIIRQLLAMGGWVEDDCVCLPVSGVRCVFLPAKCSVVDWVTLHPCGGGVYYRLMWQKPLCSCHPSHLSNGYLRQNMEKVLHQYDFTLCTSLYSHPCADLFGSTQMEIILCCEICDRSPWTILHHMRFNKILINKVMYSPLQYNTAI